jgi:RNase P subunit RPR2
MGLVTFQKMGAIILILLTPMSIIQQLKAVFINRLPALLTRKICNVTGLGTVPGSTRTTRPREEIIQFICQGCGIARSLELRRLPMTALMSQGF